LSLDSLIKVKEQGQTQFYIYGGEYAHVPEEQAQGLMMNLYTIDDLINIKSLILELMKQIKMPSNQDPDREKKIYSQIVRILSENIEYDDWAVGTTKEKYEEKTGKNYDEYVEKNKGRDLTIISRESRNLVGLLRRNAVCQGFAEIIRNIAAEYGILVTCVRGAANGRAHEWNQVKLDGIWYDDDFTNYREDLVDGKLDECHTFLMGTRADGEVLTKVSGIYKTSRMLHNVGKSISRDDKKILLSYGRVQQQDKHEFSDLQEAITGYSNYEEYQQACVKAEGEYKQSNDGLDKKIEIAVEDR
jgi:hypothetical protein